MKFENTFAVKAPIDQVWGTLLDIEKVAPCMPGAEVLEQTGDDAYKVAVKVKLGPMSMQYKGDLQIVEADPAAHQALMDAKAKEARGQGTANAQIQMNLTENGEITEGTIATDIKLSGKAAAMGAGVIQDVSAKLVDTFATNLATMLANESAPALPAEPVKSVAPGVAATEEAPAPAAEPAEPVKTAAPSPLPAEEAPTPAAEPVKIAAAGATATEKPAPTRAPIRPAPKVAKPRAAGEPPSDDSGLAVGSLVATVIKGRLKAIRDRLG